MNAKAAPKLKASRGKKNPITPDEAARTLAGVFRSQIPATKYDPLGTVSAYDMAQMIVEQTGCTFREAARAAAKAAPTLFA